MAILPIYGKQNDLTVYSPPKQVIFPNHFTYFPTIRRLLIIIYCYFDFYLIFAKIYDFLSVLLEIENEM